LSDSGANHDLCSACGGLCCMLYLAVDEDGAFIGADWLPDYVALWNERLVASGALLIDEAGYRAGVAGVEPLHDPRISTLPTPEGAAYRAALPPEVDPAKCPFCDAASGCRLPRSHRAPICNEWTCELWEPPSA
jgi:hypothetical protein